MNVSRPHFLPLFIERLHKWALNDGEFFQGAKGMARIYMEDARYRDHDARVDALIKREAAKSFATGFVTGLGGIPFLPVGLSAGLALALLFQIRLCQAIAIIYGHNAEDIRVQQMQAVCQLGEPAKEAIKKQGNKWWAASAMRWLNPAVESQSTRLATAAAPRAASPYARAIPVIGAALSGALDMTSVLAVGKTAKAIFRQGPAQAEVPFS
jgi:hypothetical protein